MAAGSHFGCPKITLYRISYHFRSIPQFLFLWIFLQNGCRRPFCMSENHFRSHFWPFQINMQLYLFFEIFIFVNFFYKMAAGGHFGCPIINFGRISGHFRSIRNFLKKITKWLPSAILDVRNSLLAILDQYRFFYFFLDFVQYGCRWPYWMSENHFRSHFWPFQIDTQLYFFWKFLTKWLPSAILDVRNSLWITFLAILDQYRFFIFFYKMAAGGHFGCPKITFDLISIHFTSIRNFIFFWNFCQNGCRRPFWMSEIHFRSHFWPFQIDWPFWISEIHFRSQFWPCFSGGHFGCLIITLDRILAISDWSAILDVRNSLWMAFLAISDPYGTLFILFKFLTKWPLAILDVRK